MTRAEWLVAQGFCVWLARVLSCQDGVAVRFFTVLKRHTDDGARKGGFIGNCSKQVIFNGTC